MDHKEALRNETLRQEIIVIWAQKVQIPTTRIANFAQGGSIEVKDLTATRMCSWTQVAVTLLSLSEASVITKGVHDGGTHEGCLIK